MQGWECPKCNKIYAPNVTECYGCNQAGLRPWTAPGTGTPMPQYPFGGTPINEMPCLIEEFFKNNPKERVAMISCPCPRCTPYCLSISY